MAEKRDSAQTQKYINESLSRFLRIADIVKRTKYAWAYLRGMRRMGDDQLCRSLGIGIVPTSGAPTDPNLADAEHYMYARFLASSTGDPATKSLVYGYELVKVVRYFSGKEKDLRTDPRFPVLPPSAEAIKWGAQGVDDGLQDYRQLHNGRTGEVGSAVRANRDFASGQYRNYYHPVPLYPATGT